MSINWFLLPFECTAADHIGFGRFSFFSFFFRFLLLLFICLFLRWCNDFPNVFGMVACIRAAIKNESTYYDQIQFKNRSRAVSGDDGIHSETPREQLYLLIVCYRGNSDCSVPVNGLTTRRLNVRPFARLLSQPFSLRLVGLGNSASFRIIWKSKKK